MSISPRAPRRGRPRDRDITERAIEATLEILAQDGAQALSIEAVARRTGVSRPAIYKRWGSLADLVLDAAVRVRDRLLAVNAPVLLKAPDTGTLSGDLAAFARQGFELLAMLEDAGVTRSLLSESIRWPALAMRVGEQLFAGDEEILTGILERARVRGEIRSAADVLPVFHALVGYGLFRRYFLYESLDDQGLERLCALLAAGLDTGRTPDNQRTDGQSGP